MSTSMKIGYYPGCSAKGSSLDYELSSNEVCRILGIVSSVNALARNAGMIMGIALSVAVYAAVQSYFESTGLAHGPAFMHGYQAAMLFGAAMAFIGGILSAVR